MKPYSRSVGVLSFRAILGACVIALSMLSGAQAATIDVVVTSVFLGGSPQLNQPIQISVDVGNIGDMDLIVPVDVLLTSNFGAILETDADFSNDTKSIFNSAVDPIGPGQFKRVSFTWIPRGTLADLIVTAIVDPSNLIVELDENNNESSQIFAGATSPPPVPLPAALPLYGTGLAVMGFIGWRRRRKAAALN